MRERAEELQTENQRLARGKKKLQEEVHINFDININLLDKMNFPQLDDVTLTMETQRGQISALEKKQKKFDAVSVVYVHVQHIHCTYTVLQA